MNVAMSECDQMGLELFEVVEVIAFVEDGEYMPVEARRRRKHVMFSQSTNNT